MLEARRVSLAAMLFLPAGLVLYFAFNSGGFHPGAPAFVAMIMCIAIAVRAGLAGAPFTGLSRSLALAVGALGLYSIVTLISGGWSHAPGVARVELDLPLVYLLSMLLFGSLGRTRDRSRWILRGFGAAAVIVCAAGLTTRLLPHVWPITPSVANNRLSFPVTYWNVLGLIAAIGIVICLHLSSDLRESNLSRVLGAGAVPILACTLLFTFSRGAIGTCVIIVVLYVVLGRPGALLSSALAIAPFTAISLKVAYDANLLATVNPTTSGAVMQGHHVAVVVMVCTAAALVVRTLLAVVLDEKLRRFRLQSHVRVPLAWVGWAAAALVALILVAALHGTIAREFHRFLRPLPVSEATTNLRARLLDPSNNGRIDEWRVAWHQFKAAPVVGHGAGTYAYAWARYRTNLEFVLDAHSLYMETLDELGIVGLVLLLTTIVAVLAGVASRIRGRGRPLYAAAFAILLGWAIHAGLDWDWEMPVVSVVFFSLGGFLLGQRLRRTQPPASGPGRGTRSRRTPRPASGRATRFPRTLRLRSAALPSRVVLSAVFLLLAVVPAFTWVSQKKLDDAAYAFSQGDCVAARRAALSSISVLGDRAEPYEIVGYCDVRLGMPRAALAAIEKAISLDPNNWNYRYDLAVMQAAAGLDPRAAARVALAFDSREALVQQEWLMFRSGNRSTWRADASEIVNSFNLL